jgi:hypothetical protein
VQPNRSGSTPLHLGVQPTGRGGSHSEEARHQQSGIIKRLLERGAKSIDQDALGKTVLSSCNERMDSTNADLTVNSDSPKRATHIPVLFDPL